MDFLAKIKRLIGFAQITGPADNSKQYPVQQISYFGKTADAFIVFPYGMYSNVSSSHSLGVRFSIDGTESNRAVLPTCPEKRPRDLEQNEVSVYHPFTNASVKFRNNGDIVIDATASSANVIVNAINVTTNTETANVNATTSVEFDTPAAQFTGNLTVQGDFVAEANASFTTNITSNGKNIGDTHKHPYKNPEHVDPILPVENTGGVT